MIITKTQHKSFLLFFSIISLLLIQYVSIIPYSFGDVNTETSTIRSNWFYALVGDYRDTTIVPGEVPLRISSGGSDLKTFQNLGCISATEDALLYKSIVTFGYEVTAHSAVGWEDQYPNHYQSSESYWYFAITKQSAYQDRYVYDVTYNNLHTGTERRNSYDGHIPITFGIRDTSAQQPSLTVNGHTFDMPEYVADIMGVKVQMLRDGVVGEYTDQFEDLSGIESGSVNLVEIEGYNMDQADVEVRNYINGADLGFNIDSISDESRSPTLQQKILDGSQDGVEWHNPSPARDKTFTIQLYAKIQPQIIKRVQYNKVTRAEILYDDWGINEGHIDVVAGPTEVALPERVVAIHADNYFMHWDLEIEVEFYATIPSTAELSEAILSDPYLKMGDFVWDTSITGDYKVEVPMTWSSLSDWLADLFGIFGGILGFIIFVVVLIVGIYLFVKIGVPLIVKKYKKRR